MSLDFQKALDDLKAAVEPELRQRADELRKKFLDGIEDFVDKTQLHKLDALIARAADYEVKAVLATERDTAAQYATAADDVLRQIKLIVITERISASRETAALIQAAALTVWDGFKSVAAGVLNVAVSAALSGLLGPAGGKLADMAGGFLGGVIERFSGDTKSGNDTQPKGEDNG